MRFKLLAMASILVLQLAVGFASANSDEPTCEALLSSRQMDVLEAASKSRYQARLFTGEVDGRPKSIVLLGEYHTKDAVESQLGLDVLSEFNFRGLEGVFGATPISRYYMFYRTRILDPLGQYVLGRREKGSTLHDAYDHGSRPRDMSLSFADFETTSNPTESFDRELRHALIKFPKMDMLLGPNFEGMDCYPEQTVNVLLEVNHEPTFAENVRMATDPLMLVTAGANLCQVVVKVTTGHSVFDPLYLAGASFTFLSGVGFQVQGAKLLKAYEDRAWYQTLFALKFGHLNGRNKTMIKNVIKALERYSGRDQMLVIVGIDHIPGMRSLLLKEGFVEQSLPFNEAE